MLTVDPALEAIAKLLAMALLLWIVSYDPLS
jgi:hypothetical protein